MKNLIGKIMFISSINKYSLQPLFFFRAMLACIAFIISMFAANANAFDLKDTTGQAQRLADLKGKWVVVNFWATWCAPCVKEIPDFAAFAKAQGDKVRVIGVALDWDETGKRETDERKVKAFAKKVGLTYSLVLGDDKSEKVFGKMKGLPTTIIYDPAGKIVFQKTGVVTPEMLSRVIAGEKVS
jgi:thiol-disulfide isomerase/thioredoxin